MWTDPETFVKYMITICTSTSPWARGRAADPGSRCGSWYHIHRTGWGAARRAASRSPRTPYSPNTANPCSESPCLSVQWRKNTFNHTSHNNTPFLSNPSPPRTKFLFFFGRGDFFWIDLSKLNGENVHGCLTHQTLLCFSNLFIYFQCGTMNLTAVQLGKFKWEQFILILVKNFCYLFLCPWPQVWIHLRYIYNRNVKRKSFKEL